MAQTLSVAEDREVFRTLAPIINAIKADPVASARAREFYDLVQLCGTAPEEELPALREKLHKLVEGFALTAHPA